MFGCILPVYTYPFYHTSMLVATMSICLVICPCAIVMPLNVQFFVHKHHGVREVDSRHIINKITIDGESLGQLC
jgi:hypothetical protein